MEGSCRVLLSLLAPGYTLPTLFYIVTVFFTLPTMFYIAYNVLHCCRFFCTAIIAFSAYIVASYTGIHPLCMIYL